MNGPNKERDPKQAPEQMLGGYATGNLSDQEKEALFAAALRDQKLFDALMEEEALRELVEQPGVKRELIDALTPRATMFGRLRKWLATPMAWGAAGAAATAALVVVMITTRMPESHPLGELARQEPVAAPKADLPLPRMTAPPVSESRRNAPARPPAEPPAAAANEMRAKVLSRKEEGEVKREAPAVAPERDQRVMEDAATQVAQPQQQAPRQIRAIQEQQALPQQALDQQTTRQDRQQQNQGAVAPSPALGAAAPAAPPPAAKKVAVPALEYALLKRNEQDEYAAATAFRESDAVRIRVTANEDGFLTLTRRGEPKPIVSALAVRAGQTLQLPASGFLLPGTQPYLLVFSRPLAAPGSSGIIGGFRQRAAKTAADELSKSKDAVEGQQVVFEILIRGEGN